jgi:hypothetical protein
LRSGQLSVKHALGTKSFVKLAPRRAELCLAPRQLGPRCGEGPGLVGHILRQRTFRLGTRAQICVNRIHASLQRGELRGRLALQLLHARRNSPFRRSLLLLLLRCRCLGRHTLLFAQQRRRLKQALALLRNRSQVAAELLIRLDKPLQPRTFLLAHRRRAVTRAAAATGRRSVDARDLIAVARILLTQFRVE